MSLKNPKAGKGACPTCAGHVWFRASPSGKLTYTCDHCDSAGYAEAGGQAHAKWLSSIDAKTAPAPAAPTPPAPPEPPKPKAKADPFAIFRGANG